MNGLVFVVVGSGKSLVVPPFGLVHICVVCFSCWLLLYQSVCNIHASSRAPAVRTLDVYIKEIVVCVCI